MATDGNGNGQDRNAEHWQELYGAALQEVSIDTLPRRIQDAEQAIAAEIKRSNGVRDGRQALLDALSALRDLRQISQAFPVYASDKS
jgi:hypothetical protein